MKIYILAVGAIDEYYVLSASFDKRALEEEMKSTPPEKTSPYAGQDFSEENRDSCIFPEYVIETVELIPPLCGSTTGRMAFYDKIVKRLFGPGTGIKSDTVESARERLNLPGDLLKGGENASVS